MRKRRFATTRKRPPLARASGAPRANRSRLGQCPGMSLERRAFGLLRSGRMADQGRKDAVHSDPVWRERADLIIGARLPGEGRAEQLRARRLDEVREPPRAQPTQRDPVAHVHSSSLMVRLGGGGTSSRLRTLPAVPQQMTPAMTGGAAGVHGGRRRIRLGRRKAAGTNPRAVPCVASPVIRSSAWYSYRSSGQLLRQ